MGSGLVAEQGQDFEYCWSSADVGKAFSKGKFATLIGVEGYVSLSTLHMNRLVNQG